MDSPGGVGCDGVTCLKVFVALLIILNIDIIMGNVSFPGCLNLIL